MSKISNLCHSLVLSALVAFVVQIAGGAPVADVILESFADGLQVTGASGAVYTLSLGEGNTVNAAGQIEIGADSQVGATLTADRSLGTKMTVLVKYAAMPASEAAVVSIFEDNDAGTAKVYPGARWRGAAATDLVGFYEDSQERTYFFSSGGGGADNSSPDPTAAGYLMFSYDLAAGSACYAGESCSALSGGYVTGLKFGNRTNRGLAIGGPYTDSHYPACAGMKIEKVAVFLNQYHAGTTVTAYSDFAWPSEFSRATVSESTDFASIDWSEGHSLYRILTVQNNPTITVSSLVELVSLEIVGDCTIVAGDNFYEEGCWIKPLIAAGTLTVTGSVRGGTLKEGYHAAIVLDSQSISLRAQTKEVISINLTGGKNGGSGSESETANVVTGTDYYGLAPVPGNTWNNINRRWQSGGVQTVSLNSALAYDGESTATRSSMKLSASANNTWQDDSITNPFLRGYLDDGQGVTVNVTGIPYETYDVIIYATSDSSLQLAPITVNGVKYTFKDGATVVDDSTTAWGVGRQATPVFGKNALLVKGQSRQDLTISSTRMPDGGPRATLCAVQVINMGGAVIDATVYTKTVATTETEGALTTIAYDQGALVSSEFNDVVLTLEGTAEDEPYALTFDQADTKLGMVKLIGARPVALTTAAGLTGIPEIDFSEYTGTFTTLSVDHTADLRMTGSIACSGTVTKSGTGTILFNGANTFTNLVVAGGLAKAGTATGFGANNYQSGELATISVASGATLDLAGTGDTSYAITIAGDGYDGNGALINTGSVIGTGTRQTQTIELAADASVGGTATFGLLANGYGPTTLALGEHTLTKKGSNTFLLCATTVSGSGRIVIESGTVQVVNNAVAAPDATLALGASGRLQVDAALSVANLQLTATSTVTGGSVVTVSDTLAYAGEATEFNYAPVTLGPDATVTIPEGAKVRVTMPSLAAMTLPGAYAEVPIRVVFNGMDYALAQVERTPAGVTIRPALQRVNAVTGDVLEFVYVFRGTTSGDWTDISNWYSDGKTAWTAYPETHNSPHRRQRDDAARAESPYDPVLIDGALIENEANRTVTVGQLEGWNPRVGVTGGARVTISSTGKWQTGDGGGKWLYIAGEGSQLRMTEGNPDVPVYCASEDGFFYDRVVDRGSVQYYLAGAGTVKYQGLTGGTHKFKRFDFSIGDSTKTRGICSKKLVSVPNTTVAFTVADDCVVTITDAADHEDAAAVYAAALAGDEDLGVYTLETRPDGVYVKYIGYSAEVESITPKLRGTGTVDWSDAANWNVASAPTSGEAVIETAGELTVNVTGAVEMQKLTVMGAEGSVVTIVGDGFAVEALTVGAHATYRMTKNAQYATLAGEGTIVFDPGAGQVITAGDENAEWTGRCIVRSGTLLMGTTTCFGPHSTSSRVTVESGAALDMNGLGGNIDAAYNVTLAEGAVFTNSKAAGTDSKWSFLLTGLTLVGDAEIRANEHRVGLARGYNHPTTVALGTNTLTKTGAAECYFSCPTFSGSGCFKIAEGNVQIAHDYNGQQPSCAQGTIEVCSGSSISLETYTAGTTLTAKNLILNGAINLDPSCSVVVNGTLSGQGSAPSLTLGADAVIKLDGVSAPTVGALVLAEGDTVELDLEGLDLSSLNVIPVLKVTDAANLPAIDKFTGVPRRWALVPSNDGKTLKLRKQFFTITVR